MLAPVSARAEEIASNLQGVRRGLDEAAAAAGRDPAEVRLIVVTKTVPLAGIRDAIAAGARDLGENYVTELREKQPAITVPGVRWHYIGALQTHTAHRVADLADVVHTVAGERAARRLAGRAPAPAARSRRFSRSTSPSAGQGSRPRTQPRRPTSSPPSTGSACTAS